MHKKVTFKMNESFAACVKIDIARFLKPQYPPYFTGALSCYTCSTENVQNDSFLLGYCKFSDTLSPHSTPTRVNKYPRHPLFLACTRYESIRLQGGQNSSHGRVELCLNQHWRALCANHWEDADAQVACRELGFSATGIEMVISCYRC